MDDLEKAILIIFDESGAIDEGLKKQTKNYGDEIKGKPSISSLCIEKLCFSNLVQVQFWSLQTLHEVIRVRYSVMGPYEKYFIRKWVFSIACFEGVDDKNVVRVLEGPAFLKNKLAQVLVTLIYFEYPLIWSSVFVDFLPHLSKGAMVIDMFCRVLNALDDGLISLDYPRTPEEISVAARVKDAMRQQCVAQIVRAWYDIVSMYKNSDQELCTSVLDSTRRYISWIDIGLVANDAFIPLLFHLILVRGLSEQLRGAAVRCLLAVVSKRMDPQSKLSLLHSLQISPIFGLVTEDGDCELVSDIAELLTGEKQLLHVGQILEVIRVLIRHDPVYRNNLDILDKIGREEEDRMVEYRKDLFVLLRNVGRVAPDVTHLFIKNSLSSALTSSSESNVEEVEAALSLLYALGESNSDEATRTGSRLLSELVPMLLSTRFPCHSNRLVALVYLETVTRYVKFVEDKTHYIHMVLAAFLDERGIHHPNINVSQRASYLLMRVVKLLKVKLVPFIETILQSLQDVVARFTSMDYTSKVLSGAEDGSHVFETSLAIGILIGLEEVPLEKQSDYLSSLLRPLCQQVEQLLTNAKALTPEEIDAKVVTLQQIIMAMNALSKGFSERLATASRPAIGPYSLYVSFRLGSAYYRYTTFSFSSNFVHAKACFSFLQNLALDVLLQVLVVFPKIEPLWSKVTSFIHRMVETLGASVFPYLPKALVQLLADSEPNEMVAFLVLLNQLICKFNTLVHDILEELFPAIAVRIFSTIPRDALPSDPGTVTEEICELQELQRTFYTFLHVIATHDLSSVFLSPKSRVYLDPVMQLLLNSSCSHEDILVRKACVQIFIRLIKDWCAGTYGEEKVPGFQSFVIEAFATNCCLYSVLDRTFEFHDSNTLVLFGEIVLAQKIMYEKFGDDFLIYFVSKGFPAAHCPQVFVEQYRQKLQGTDIKALKSFCQSLIENLRHQQNESLVFR
ncbi:exportin-T [Quillaja saponaria]|uniref:Exportin-T n=1 Tax=Quillaja saponaria TaxID=32244 RepID=A0AAD7L534_QUISA|nr:exportin-T [Quillaja saponaria]